MLRLFSCNPILHFEDLLAVGNGTDAVCFDGPVIPVAMLANLDIYWGTRKEKSFCYFQNFLQKSLACEHQGLEERDYLKVLIFQRNATTGHWRLILNIDEVEQVVRTEANKLFKSRPLRLEILSLAGLSFWDQVKLFMDVDVAIGVVGSDLYSASFLRPGAALIFFNTYLQTTLPYCYDWVHEFDPMLIPCGVHVFRLETAKENAVIYEGQKDNPLLEHWDEMDLRASYNEQHTLCALQNVKVDIVKFRKMFREALRRVGSPGRRRN
jgi:hypothetical protein